MTVRDIEVKGLELDADSWSVNSLLDSIVDRVETDIEKFSSKSREYENIRFASLGLVSLIYAILVIIFLQFSIDKGVESAFPIFGEPFSKRIFVGIFISLAGFFVLSQFAVRFRPSIRARNYLLSVLKIRTEFAEQMLVRISTWESKFKGDFYEKSIIRLKLETLGHLIDEMKMIIANEEGRFISRNL